MMPVHELLTTLANLNVKLWVEADRLRLSAPTGVLTSDLQNQLRLQKSEILSLFARQNGKTEPAIIRPAPRGERIPLSFAQQRLWFLAQLEGPSATYNLPSAFRLHGRLDSAALQHALDQVVTRHESLRTTFASFDNIAWQVIAPPQPVPITCHDLSTLPADQQPAAVQQLIDQAAQMPFDLERGPLLHVHLVKLSDVEHVLSLTLHHIISDGWSAGIFMQEFCTYYIGEVQGKSPQLPPLTLQYADYALWQQGQTLDRQLAYWRDHLTGAPPLLELPTDWPRPAQQRFVGDQLTVTLAGQLHQQLEQLTRQQHVTLHMTLLAAFALLLARYSGVQEVVIGTPVANRNRPEIEPLIGFFVNTLALRFDLSGNPSFRELLTRVRQVTLDGYAHQDAPFEQVVELLQPQRQLSYTPLFQVVFNLMTLPPVHFTLPGLEISPLESASKSAKFDLALNVSESDASVTATWEYNSELFERTTIERMARHWQHILAAVISDPEQPIRSLPLFDAAELRQLLADCQGEARPLPADLTIQRLFELQVERRPDAPALIFEEHVLTYRELNQRANQLAHFLRRFGTQTGMYVGLCIERSPEMVIGMLGILKAGAAYVPLDPELPAERLQFMVQDAEIRFALTSAAAADAVEALHLPFVRLDDDWPQITDSPTDNPQIVCPGETPIYLIYTSGSTGTPKGVIVPQRGVVNTISALKEATGIGSGDRVLQFVPFSFDAAAVEFFGALCSGATLVMHPAPTRLSSLELLRLCETQRISVVNFTVALWQQWVDDLAQQALHFPASLRLFLTGGEKPSAERLQRWAQLGEHTMDLACAYGPTEASITSTLYCISNHAVRANPPAIIPLGIPLPNTSIYLLDAHQQLVPAGATGEIYLGGQGVATGYLDRDELTSERFLEFQPHTHPALVRDGVAPGRFYRTGDLARRRSDGAFEFVGRSDSQVKVRGFRVELGEIEAVLKSAPSVIEAVVNAVEINVTPAAPQDKRLLAYVQPATLEVEALKSFLRARLPAHMVPLAIVALDHWPLTHNGKIDRKALPLPNFQADGTHYLAPQSASEIKLAALWADLLHVSKVGLESNFFDLGGHSLLATQLVSRIRQELHVELPLRTLFAEPTLRALAEQIAQHQSTANRPPIEPTDRTGDLPLSFAQQRLWLLQQLNPESGFFNMPMALRLDGPLDVEALQASFAEIVRRHEILRTTFPTVDGEPVQRITPAQETLLEIPLLDLQVLDGVHHEQIMHMMAEDEASTPFDLAKGPLLRLKLLRITADAHLLLLTMHHIAGDDWSNVLLMQEFSALYTAFARGEASPLPELGVQYGDFARWQRTWLQGEFLEQQLDYWRKHLADAPPLLQLPLDRSRPAQQRFVGNTVSFVLAADLLGKVRELSRQQQVTPHMLLLATFAVLLARYSAVEDLAIGIPVANRTHAQIEPLVGFFLNTLALRVKLQGEPSFLELLHQVKSVTTGGYEHQEVPFEQVIEALVAEGMRGRPQLSHSPIFQVMFNYLQDHGSQWQIPGLAMTPLAVDNHTAKFDITLTASESTDELSLSWEYNSDLFEPATIERMARHFEQLLRAALADLSIPVAALPLLNPAERQQLLYTWNQTEVAIPDNLVMHQLFEQQVERTPDTIAASCGGELISYRRLNERANRWAHGLVDKGVRADQVVAILAPRNLDFLSAILAIHKAGGAYLPIDPKTPAERIRTILQQSRVSILISCSLLQSSVTEALAGIAGDQRPTVLLIEEFQRLRASANNLPPRSKPKDLAYVIYTSGSTGIPKGAMVEQRGLVNHLLAMQRNLQLTPTDVIAQSATQSYVISVWQFLAALVVGCQVEIIPEEVAMEPARLLRTLAERKVTVLQIVPSLLRAMMAEIERTPHLLASLRWLIPTGEALPPALVRDWFALCPQIPLLNAYGASECSDDVAHDRIDAPPALAVANMPAGRPIGNVRMLVLDQHLQPVPIGVEGELYVGGACVGRGYLHDSERTAALFLSDPFHKQPPARLYRTGDKVRWLANGKLEYLGRRDFQVKVRGFRIELGEIEATLAKHPAVEQAVVTAREDGQGNKQLIAYAVARSSEEVTGNELRSFVAQHLPDYMVPATVMLLDQMPLNANGKLNRLALPALTQLVNVEAQPYVAPRNAIEAELVTILANVLGIEESRLGIRHSFFDLGGHSLLAVQLLAQLRNSFGLELPLRRIFEHTTVEALADFVFEQQLTAVDEALWLPLLDQMEMENNR